MSFPIASRSASAGDAGAVTVWAKDLKAAQAAAYAAVEKIHFDGAQFGRDIAVKAMSRVATGITE
jgi:phosphoribosylamine-glycine ligase